MKSATETLVDMVQERDERITALKETIEINEHLSEVAEAEILRLQETIDTQADQIQALEEANRMLEGIQ